MTDFGRTFRREARIVPSDGPATRAIKQAALDSLQYGMLARAFADTATRPELFKSHKCDTRLWRVTDHASLGDEAS